MHIITAAPVSLFHISHYFPGSPQVLTWRYPIVLTHISHWYLASYYAGWLGSQIYTNVYRVTGDRPIKFIMKYKIVFHEKTPDTSLPAGISPSGA